ncbi:transposase zinc-binding domain-containing protein [Mesorhizobium sp. M0046]|uniref:transposase zinc-binding domain-containing protein n=1 Tax=Mesorhizobium sp. M0046 TaxID=2956858 RepID=UPI0033358934
MTKKLPCECQGKACREWLTARQDERLPVPYFHVVFTLPAQITAIAFPEQGGALHDPVQDGV